MQPVDKPTCAICYEEYTEGNFPIYEPVNHHHFHGACWDKTFQEQGKVVREGGCLKNALRFIFWSWVPYHNVKAIKCPLCATWIREDELTRDVEVQSSAERPELATETPLMFYVSFVVSVIAVGVVLFLWTLIRLLISPCTDIGPLHQYWPINRGLLPLDY